MSNVFDVLPSDVALALATAFAVAHTHNDVWTALRFHRRMAGRDYTGYLSGRHFGSHGDVDLFDIRDQANNYLDGLS